MYSNCSTNQFSYMYNLYCLLDFNSKYLPHSHYVNIRFTFWVVPFKVVFVLVYIEYLFHTDIQTQCLVYQVW